MSEEKKVEERTVVVAELPSQQVSEAETPEGEKLKFITVNDALTEMREDIKAIRRSTA